MKRKILKAMVKKAKRYIREEGRGALSETDKGRKLLEKTPKKKRIQSLRKIVKRNQRNEMRNANTLKKSDRSEAAWTVMHGVSGGPARIGASNVKALSRTEDTLVKIYKSRGRKGKAMRSRVNRAARKEYPDSFTD